MQNLHNMVNIINTNEEVIRHFLNQLDYSKDAIEIYLSLIKNGPSTLLRISKDSRVERTKLYRLVDQFIQNGVVEEVPAYKQKTIKAVDLSAIEILVKEKEARAISLARTLPVFSKAVRGFAKNNIPDVNVVYYRGIEGMKQMIWHVTRCKGLFRTYSCQFWNELVGDKFTLNINREMNARHFKVHDLYSDQYIKYKEEWMATRGKKPSGDWSFWKAHFIPEKYVKINQNIDIYNDIVAYSHWDKGEMFGVEIQNQRVADMQKQVHDVLWKMSKRVDHFDWQNPVWKK